MSTVLTVSLVKRFGQSPVIRTDNLCIADSGITVLFGPSGSGKTTLLRCLAGLEKPDEGIIRYRNESWVDVKHGVFLSPQERNVGFVPQDYGLFPHLSVDANVGYGLWKLSKRAQKEKITQTLDWVGLTGLERRLPKELSGGQQQRVALARAVVRHPQLLLLDEPLAALDTPTRLRLRNELRQLLKQLGIPTVLVTHDRLEALALADTLVVLDNGSVLQQGPPHLVFSQPASLAVAGIVAMETVQPGRVFARDNGLVTVKVGDQNLIALDRDLPSSSTSVYVCIRAEDVVLTKTMDAHSSPRNRLMGTVRGLNIEGPMVRVDLDCGFGLMALLTKQGCEDLGLKIADHLTILIKVPNIHLLSHSE